MITIVQNNDAVFQSLKTLCKKKHGIDLTAVTPAEADTHVGTMAILDPFPIADQLYSMGNIWLRYYNKSEKYQNQKLLLFGDNPFSEHPNFFYYLEIPENFFARVQSLHPVSQLKAFPECGEDISDTIYQQIRGHGRFSLYKSIEKLAWVFQWAETALYEGGAWEEVKENYFSKITRKEALELVLRWNRYLPYYAFLPTELQISSYTGLIEKISSFYDSGFPACLEPEVSKLGLDLWDLLEKLKYLQKFFNS